MYGYELDCIACYKIQRDTRIKCNKHLDGELE